MELNRTPVPRNLRTRPTFFGLEFEHCIIIVFLMFVGYFVGGLVHRELFGIPMNFVVQYGVPLLSVPVLIAFQYGKPRGYLRDWLIFHIKPHLYCGAEPDTVLKTDYFGGGKRAETRAD
jgi:hypothetical protein